MSEAEDLNGHTGADDSAEHAGEVAVVGLTGRFPRARGVDEFWRNLREGVEAISHFTVEEMVESGVSPEVAARPDYVRARGTLEDVEMFDAAFFGFTPREAEITDPQHRLFLECAWEALEHAGYDSERYEGRVGVYAGVSMNTYLLNLYLSRELGNSVSSFRTMIGNDKDYLPTWVSYKLNLTGPSVNVQTACSTSLVAVHLACQSLLNGECDTALAGGVSVGVPQKSGYLFEEGGILSRDGHCRAFDARAEGTVAGSGVGVVVLKRLDDALRDGDTVHAVIKGSAVNNDGSVKIGYTAPSVKGQAAVIAEVLGLTDIDPATVTYVETHGTGTPLGDPIEIAALTQAFRARTDRKGFCAIGSVKTNVGHLDAAAGVTGLIKTVLALKHREIPPSLHYEQPNPKIDFPNTPFYVNAKLAAWEAPPGTPRRAGVSSFGIGGTNAHLILEEAPAPPETSAPARAAQLLVLSARTETALASAASNLAAHLGRHDDLELADVAYTLQTGRRPFAHRLALVCRDRAEAVKALAPAADGKATGGGEFVSRGVAAESARPVVFMFPGQGTQYVGMGRGLYEAESVFRAEVDGCAALLKPLTGFDLREVMFAAADDAEAAGRLGETYVTQPALFVVEYALAKLLMSWGVEPAALAGHSIGEYVAACLAGVMSLADALRLVEARGRLMQRSAPGAMLAVSLAEDELRPLLGERLWLAAVNGPAMCVAAGDAEAVAELEQRLGERGVSAARLHTTRAFHSGMMEAVLPDFAREVARVRLSPPKIPYVSNVTGTWMTDEDATDPAYWTRHLRETVRFGEGVRELLRDDERVLLEVGPGRTLAGLVRRQLQTPTQDSRAGRVVLSTLRAAKERQPDAPKLLHALGGLWAAGVKVDWQAFTAGERRRRVPLPTYPFERKRYWVERPRNGNGHHAHAATPTQPQTETQTPAQEPTHAQTHTQSPAHATALEARTAPPPAHAEADAQDFNAAALEGIMARQLELMRHQLEVLRDDAP